jgi:peptidoglycan/xylan/chitin deacetylase (PgdA/CDA1 family)
MFTPLKKVNRLFAAFLLILIILFIAMLLHKSPKDRQVLLSFDIEPVDGREDVSKLIDVLDAAKINATFFVTGEYALQYPDVVRKMMRYDVGCHGQTHAQLTKLNTSEKKKEIELCKRTVEAVLGKKIIGFRAPYTRIDHETLSILEENGFLYDASIINGLGLFYPSLKSHNIGEIPVSSISGIPIEDVIWLYYLRMPSTFFYIIENRNSEYSSYLFHPHHIMVYRESFIKFINHLKERNTIFISHYQLVLN